jgi:putative tryptophan/tyrosine transport system substrate-binding protein
MQRREFIAGLGSVGAWSVVARAQALPVVGFRHSQTPDLYGDVLAGFHQGLRDVGYEDGRNITIEYRWANDKIERRAPFFKSPVAPLAELKPGFH